MKTLITLFVATFLVVASVSADDAAIVANWKFPVAYWFPNGPLPAEGIANVPRAQALADPIVNFDPTLADFDAVWSSLSNQGVSGAGYPIANTTGNANSDHGAADFTAAFKVVYDDVNMYVLVQYLDDDITETEGVEIMWAPYFDIPEVAALASAISSNPQQASHVRYAQFGAYKANFAFNGSVDATIVDFTADGTGSFKPNSTNDVIANNLFNNNYTVPGSQTVKAIYTIGYEALTGNAYAAELNARPDFNPTIWKALNDGKGISFDIHIVDNDTNDALNTATPPVVKPQEYWWNSTSNEGWCETYYSGFLGVNLAPTAVMQVNDNKQSIFGEVTSTQVKLTQNANVEVYNTIGKCVMSMKNTDNVDLTNLAHGLYIVRANNETLKIAR